MAPRLEEFETLPKNKKTVNSTISDEQTSTTTRQNESRLIDEIRRETAQKTPQEVDLPIVWRNVFHFTLLHLGALYGVYLLFYAKWQTLVFSIISRKKKLFI